MLLKLTDLGLSHVCKLASLHERKPLVSHLNHVWFQSRTQEEYSQILVGE